MNDFITACIICRNSETTIEACIRSLKPLDHLAITDTGSTDKTIDIILKTCEEIDLKFTLTKMEWVDDFSAARNFNLSTIPPETTWALWVDSDDTVDGLDKIRGLVEQIPQDIAAVWLRYDYAFDEFGNVTTVFERERLLRTSCQWVWRSRVHETVEPMVPGKFIRNDDIVIHHHHIGTPKGERNFKLLNLMIKEEPDNKRVWLYLGHQNFAEGNHMEAAKWYLKFSEADVLQIERYQALCYAARSLRAIKDYNQAIECDLAAMNLYPSWADAYVGMCLSFNYSREWDMAIYWGEQAKTKELPQKLIFVNPLDQLFNLPVTLADAYRNKGMWQESLRELLAAYRVRPVEDLKHNIESTQQTMKRIKVVEGMKALAVDLLDNKELYKVKQLPEVLPHWMRQTAEYQELVGGMMYHTADLKDNPKVVEGANETLISLDDSANPKELLAKYDGKARKVRVISHKGQGARTLSFEEMQDLIIDGGEARHILNLQEDESKVWCQYDFKHPTRLAFRMFVGPGLENWNPKTISEIGCGGSETAAYQVSKELVRRDCSAIVYAMDQQVWDGVLFRHHTKFKPDEPVSHVMISSRVPEIFNYPIGAQQKWLWFHDIHCGVRFTPEVAENIDAIIALSHWHAGHLKRVYPWLEPCEVIDLDWNDPTYEDNVRQGLFYENAKLVKHPVIAVIGDGLDTDRFRKLSFKKKVRHSFIWSSSPDRGLVEILLMWPIIRREMPDATLNIFYGWEYFDSTLNIPGQREFKENLKLLIKQDGVTWRGRVGQPELAKEIAKTDMWLYPPPHEFRETYCIGAQEMQMARVLCFYRQNGALGETVGNRGVPIPLGTDHEGVVRIIMDTLKDKNKCATLRDKGQQYARRQSWGAQAEKFLRLYELLDGRVRTGILSSS